MARELEIVDSVVDLSEMLLDEQVPDTVLYAALGQYVSELEEPSVLTRETLASHPDFDDKITKSYPRARLMIETKRSPKDLEKKGRGFLKKFWKEILAETCKWWGKNKDKYTGKEQVTALGAALVLAIPPPWNLLGVGLSIVAIILIRAGINALCADLPEKPPKPKGKD